MAQLAPGKGDALTSLVCEAPLYRAVFQGPEALVNRSGTKRPVVLACISKEKSAAIRRYAELFGEEPDHLLAVDAKLQKLGRPQPHIKQFAGRPESQFVVHTPGERVVCPALASHGILDVRFLDDPAYRKVNFDPHFVEQNAVELARVLGLLADRESREVFASVLKYRVTGDHGYFRISPYPEYQHPVVRPRRGDTVLDLGAANGTTSMAFAEAAGVKGRVFAFEPEAENIKHIDARRSGTWVADTLEIVRYAVSDQVGQLSFSGSGGSGKLDETGDVVIDVTTIDRFLTGKKLSGRLLLSFDIEGSEQAALRGAMETLKRHRPLLQVSIYHGPNSLFEIPLWLSEQLSGYTYYMGHHDSYHCETDLYCIPKEAAFTRRWRSAAADVRRKLRKVRGKAG